MVLFRLVFGLFAVFAMHPAHAFAAESALIPIITPAGITIMAEVADTPGKRARGLMFRDSLPRNRGMLFTFPEAQPWTFWMQNTHITLDIVWMDGNKKVVYVEKNVPGCGRTDDSCPQYQPTENALFVLEVAAGMADSLKLQRGAAVKFKTPGR